MVLSLYAKGLRTGEISAHFAEIYGASVNRGRYGHRRIHAELLKQGWTVAKKTVPMPRAVDGFGC
jgi:putative transposase